MKSGRIPASHGAERSILGGVLLRNGALSMPAVGRLEVEDFHDPKCRAVFMAMRNLEAQGSAIDPVTVDAELTRIGYANVGGLAYVTDLAALVPSMDNVAHYAEIVSKLAVRRLVIEAAATIVDTLRSADEEDEDLNGEAAVQFAASLLSRIDPRSPSTAKSIGTIVKDRMEQVMRLMDLRDRGGAVLTGAPTGIAKLDAKLGGYKYGVVTVIGARPGMGKSSVLLACEDAASAAGVGVHAFKLEEPEESTADRAMARESGVSAQGFQRLELERGEMSAIGPAIGRLRKRSNWVIEQGSTFTADEIVRAVRREMARNKTKVATIDYAQLVSGERAKRYKADQRHMEISDVMTTFMQAAKEDGIAYVVASQLNRKVEDRPNKRPTKADLRDSGGIEERAKCIIFPYRGSEYGPPVEGSDYPKGQRPPDDAEWLSRIELLIDKNSNGETGCIYATWHGPTMRVS